MNPFIGQIQMFGFNFPPRGWATCDGQLLSIAQNTALFSLLGTQYGGDGRTTYALPDLRGRFPLHMGQGPGLSNYTIGQRAGVETVTLLANQLPAHTHPLSASVSVPCTNAAGNADSPVGKVPAASATDENYAATPNGAMAAFNITGNTGPNTGGQPVPIIPPYLCINFSIATQGIFPSRS